MKCDFCGNIVDEKTVFCGNCGNKLSSKMELNIKPTVVGVSKRICPACKNEWGSDAVFCGECGTPLPEIMKPGGDTGLKSTIRNTTEEKDSKKILDDEKGSAFFSKAGEL